MNKLCQLMGLGIALFAIHSEPLLAQGNYVVITSNDSNTATHGTFNTLVGPGAGSSGNLTGNRNTATGYNTGRSMTMAYNNSFYGVDAGQQTTTGSQNVFMGYEAGRQNTTADFSTFIGRAAGLSNTTGSFNVFIGGQAGYSNLTGTSNVFLGNNSGYYNSDGHDNVMTGTNAGFLNTTGNANVFTGISAGQNNSTGSNNVFSGYRAGFSNTTGSNNIIIGPNSGTLITTSDDNVLMGYNSQAEDGLTNAIAIGANSRVAANNALILGHQVNVGIGTSAPAARLEIVSESQDNSGLRLTNLTSQSRSAQVADQFLTVNEQGDVVKARYQLRINNPNEWSDNVFSPMYSLRPLTTVATYIEQHGHLPDVPSAEQVAKEGVDLVKLNATLLQKIEELTLYSIQQQAEIEHLKAVVHQLNSIGHRALGIRK